MILVDSAVWIDHLRSPIPFLDRLLDERDVLVHPLILGEIGMGSFRAREEILSSLGALPRALIALDEEVQDFVTRHHLFGLGIGYLDAHILVATRLTEEALLWTRDRRLNDIAERFGLAMQNAPVRIN